MSAKIGVERIREASWYRGQALRSDEVAGESGVTAKLSDSHGQFRQYLSESVAARLGRDAGLYRHQAMSASRILSGTDCLLAAPAGSGRRTLHSLLAVGFPLVRGSSALCMGPSKKAGRRFLNRVRELIRSAGYGPALHTSESFDVESLKAAVDSGASLIVTTPRTVFRLLRSEMAEHRVRGWVASIGYCGLFGVSEYRVEELAHLSGLVRALKGAARKAVVLMSGQPMASPERFAGRVIGGEPAIVRRDDSPSSGRTRVTWFPPLDARKEADSDSKRVIRRRSALEEATRLAGCLAGEAPVERMLVWDAVRGVTARRRRKIGERIPSRPADGSGEEGGDRFPVELDLVDGPEEVPAGKARSYDVVLLLGESIRPGVLSDQLANLVREGGLVVNLVVEDPLAFGSSRTPSLRDRFPKYPEFLVPRTRKIETAYLRLLLGSCAGESVSIQAIRRFEVDEEDVKEATGPPVGDDGDGRWSGRPPECTVEWGQLGEEALRLDWEAAGTWEVDRYQMPHLVHDGALVVSPGGEPYRVDLSDGQAQRATEDHPLSIIPDLEFEVLNFTEEGKTRRYDAGTTRMTLRRATVGVQSIVSGYYRLTDYADEDPDRIDFSSNEVYGPRSLPALVLECPVPRETSVLLRYYLGRVYDEFDDFVAVFPDGNNVFVVAHHDAFEPVLADIRNRFGGLKRDFEAFAGAVLDTCPCTMGCSRCLRPVRRRFRGTVEKERAFKTYFPADAESRWIYKVEGVGPDKSEDYYRGELPSVLEILADRFSLEIDSVAEFKVVELEGSRDGEYRLPGNVVAVVPELPQARAIEVLAHEYAHNWEHDPVGGQLHSSLQREDLPYQGDLFVEGFAQWAAFKVCDHLALHDQARRIRIWVDDEYGDGFDFFHWLETEVAGFGGVLEFVDTGELSRAEAPDRGADELLEAWRAARAEP